MHLWIQLNYKAQDHIKITPWEREINHIATGISPQPREKLLTHGHGDEELDGEVDDDHARGGVEPSGGGSRQRFPPPIFSGDSLLPPCFWFCVSPPPPSGKRRGTLYIVVFRSRGSFWAKDRCKRHPPFWSSGLRSLTFFAPKSSPSKIMTPLNL